MKNYYWVLFEVNKYIHENGVPKDKQTYKLWMLKEEHPIDLQNSLNKQWLNHTDNKYQKKTESYYLLNWKKISKEEYDRFKIKLEKD